MDFKTVVVHPSYHIIVQQNNITLHKVLNQHLLLFSIPIYFFYNIIL